MNWTDETSAELMPVIKAERARSRVISVRPLSGVMALPEAMKRQLALTENGASS
jgi:hypothetical protein